MDIHDTCKRNEITQGRKRLWYDCTGVASSIDMITNRGLYFTCHVNSALNLLIATIVFLVLQKYFARMHREKSNLLNFHSQITANDSNSCALRNINQKSAPFFLILILTCAPVQLVLGNFNGTCYLSYRMVVFIFRANRLEKGDSFA